MRPPPKVNYKTEDEYRRHFSSVYCRKPIVTPDGVEVRFRKTDFDHCMYVTSPSLSKKVAFSPVRAERIDWIGATLRDPAAAAYQGWDRRRKLVDPSRRVTVAYEDFIVVVQTWKAPDGSCRGKFITAYPAGSDIGLVRSKPKWQKQ